MVIMAIVPDKQEDLRQRKKTRELSPYQANSTLNWQQFGEIKI